MTHAAAEALEALGDEAMAAVSARAAAAGVEVVPVTDAAGHHDVAALFCDVWNAPPTAGPVRAGTMRAAQHVGAYVVGIHVVDGGRMVAASFGFHGADGHLHSHVTGVADDWQGKGLGKLAKLHQRAWCLQRGVARVTWTFDPLVRRNAHFNLRRLGVDLVEYLPSFYGPMTDGINAGDDTDRAFVTWDLATPRVGAIVAGADPDDAGVDRADPDHVVAVVADDRDEPVVTPAPTTAAAVSVALPADIEALRAADRDAALRWRHAVRDAMHPRLAAGWRVSSFTRDGCYLLEAP